MMNDLFAPEAFPAEVCRATRQDFIFYAGQHISHRMNSIHKAGTLSVFSPKEKSGQTPSSDLLPSSFSWDDVEIEGCD